MTAPAKDVIRIDAMGDLRCPRTPDDVLRCIFGHADDEADVPLLCGDLTDYGKPEEALVLPNCWPRADVPTHAPMLLTFRARWHLSICKRRDIASQWASCASNLR